MANTAPWLVLLLLAGCFAAWSQRRVQRQAAKLCPMGYDASTRGHPGNVGWAVSDRRLPRHQTRRSVDSTTHALAYMRENVGLKCGSSSQKECAVLI
jgi:hypothetical protein